MKAIALSLVALSSLTLPALCASYAKRAGVQETLAVEKLSDTNPAATVLAALPTSEFDAVAHDIAVALSAKQREVLLLKLWEEHDVVDIMRMTGHGEGLDDIRLVHVFGDDEPREISEGDKLRLKRAGKAFIDLTETPDLFSLAQDNFANREAPAPELTRRPDIKAQVLEMSDKLNETFIRADIEKLSSFWTRNYNSNWGARSSDWIAEHVEELLKSSAPANVSYSVTKFKHKFKQSSIIARIELNDSSVTSEDKQIVILSAHQDSLNYKLPFYRSPGADDDGSGSVAIMQTLRSLLQGGFAPPPNVALEFHWYAGEEGGLLGSNAVASAYAKAKADVKGVFHIDMVAYQKPGVDPIIAFFDTNIDKNLTTFTTQLVEEYLPVKWDYTRCGDICGSDHMSWTAVGYPAVYACESLFENFLPMDLIHTSGDALDVEGYSYEHMLRFVKLNLAFVAEFTAQ